MQARDSLLEEVFPKVIAGIISDYANVFKRPFQRDRCLQCDKRATHLDLCRNHHNLCLLCCNNTARVIQDDEDDVPSYLVCGSCENRYGSAWLQVTEKAYDTDSTFEDMYQTLYQNDDHPVDIEYFKQGLLLLGMVHEEGEDYNKGAKEAFEELGGIEKVREVAQSLPDWFERSNIFSHLKEAERHIGSFTWSVVVKLIRKL